ncbi:MAG: AI-2E family transporter, partial [Cyanothece sp. SIO1E1]|nr:AI-2E family transporter [Cyanothece sp. SIO1E1]
MEAPPFSLMSKLPRPLVWGLALPIACFNGWLLLKICQYLQPLVGVFITAALIAFILDFPLRFLEKRGVTRTLAVGLVILLAIMLFGTLILILAPLIFQQLDELITRLPSWIDSGGRQLQTLVDWISAQELSIGRWSIDQLTDQFSLDLQQLITRLTEKVSSDLQSFTSQVFSFALDTISGLFNLLLTLILTVFLMLNGEPLWRGLIGWLPPRWQGQIQQSLRQNFQNYFVGQAILAVLLSILLTTA